MADFTSIVDGDDEPGGDGWTLTLLARRLGRRVPLMCFEKLVRDGRESIPTQAIPSGVDQSKYAVYKRYLKLGKINLADVIITAVTDRQRPNGFRIVSESASEDDRVDRLYSDCRMDLTIPKIDLDVATYGQSFALVHAGAGKRFIQYVSPWCAEVLDTEDAACMYWYDEVQAREYLQLMRMLRDDSGVPSVVYSRTAYRDADQRTLVAESDDDEVLRIGNTWETENPAYWVPSSGWTWEGDANSDYDYALMCEHLPLVQVRDADKQGQIYKHLATLMRISQGIFDRMCISIMQAFRQRAVKNLKKRYYSKSDPQVQAGLKQAGQKIDYSGVFEMGPASLWLLPEDCDIWESAVTDIRPLVEAESSDIKHLAAASRTPLDILSPDVAGSAEGASLKREGLTFKVEQANRLVNDSLSIAVRMALILAEDGDALDQEFEVAWLPAAPLDWQSAADASQKIGARLPDKTVWREVFAMNNRQIQMAEQDRSDGAFATVMTQLPQTTTQATETTEATQSDNPFALSEDETNGFTNG